MEHVDLAPRAGPVASSLDVPRPVGVILDSASPRRSSTWLCSCLRLLLGLALVLRVCAGAGAASRTRTGGGAGAGARLDWYWCYTGLVLVLVLILRLLLVPVLGYVNGTGTFAESGTDADAVLIVKVYPATQPVFAKDNVTRTFSDYNNTCCFFIIHVIPAVSLWIRTDALNKYRQLHQANIKEVDKFVNPGSDGETDEDIRYRTNKAPTAFNTLRPICRST
ncbi:hypothetical protein EGW08_002938 [Elysia chlorotica]|uniref:Uncharacterized protein n=1 Tax=Elysia chlorotica TaxID=188477 RepID=A0A3S1BIU4_ELYCH|nr:hypothetical protein EGW08_002938 [Elysia chlorotica]